MRIPKLYFRQGLGCRVSTRSGYLNAINEVFFVDIPTHFAGQECYLIRKEKFFFL